MEYIFEWDRKKAKENLRKHHVAFTEAEDVFVDPLKLTRFDAEHSIEEERWLTLGYSNRSRLLLVVHTEQEITVNSIFVRVISCRLATASERRSYERDRQ